MRDGWGQAIVEEQGRFPCIVMIFIAHILFCHPKSIYNNIKQSKKKKVAVKVVFSHGFHITSNGVFEAGKLSVL